MHALPPSLNGLVLELGKLPGIGPRSAERLALHLVQSDPVQVEQLAQALLTTRRQVVSCQHCGALTEQQPCAICASPQRDASLICLVERPTDILHIEKSGAFRGHYHVLGGKISPVEGIGPDDLRIGELERRLASQPNVELIIALDPDVEGDATSHYLAQRLADRGVRVSRLAFGLPVGSSLEFADELTLSQAIAGRRSFS